MNAFVGEEQEKYAAELCLWIALVKFEEGDFELAIHRAEEAIRSLKVLQEIKKSRLTWRSADKNFSMN